MRYEMHTWFNHRRVSARAFHLLVRVIRGFRIGERKTLTSGPLRIREMRWACKFKSSIRKRRTPCLPLVSG